MVDRTSLEMVEHQLLIPARTDDDPVDQRIGYATIIQVGSEEEHGEDGSDDDDEEEEEEEDGESLVSIHGDELEEEANQEEQPHVLMGHDDLDPRWVFSLERKLLFEPQIQKKSSSINGSCSIHRVPDCFRQGDENAYMPQIVSIGPFHRSKKNLQAMEDRKRNYLRDVISWTRINRGDAPSIILEKYLIAIKSVEKTARDCYSETIDLDSNAFVEMMVVDGCFIIGLLCKVAHLIHVDDGDPIFKMGWLMSKLQNDLLMLENQIPFVVLQSLFDLMNVSSGHDRTSLAHLSLNFFEGLVPKIENAMKEDPKINCQHLLHLFHSSLLPTFKKAEKKEKDNEKEANHLNLIHSVTALKEAGIKFKKAKTADNFFDVKFKNGTMEIPTVVIHGATNSLFLNLIALEQCYSDCSDHFTAYTAFMNCLINSARDVGILRRSGIVENWLGSDEDVAHLFKMLGREVAISTDGFYLSDVFKDVNLYCRTDWNAWKASLKRDYFNNPWAIISFAAAIILLGLTFIQTFFTMYSYFRPPL
ncbi:UPF0481 protein At3g47200-like [Magnolia sinica]|uniref:UPF0481 protein At3g47200-like n=1 Tax=Magnolia sinica TaxID=86752 RepID=UPI0026591C1B|nr:UPF0481 protein At3g47200-like [Magnolia sinica]